MSTPGKMTLPILLDCGATGVSVTDKEARQAMHFAATELKMILEPGGAAVLAAVLARKVDTKDRVTLVVASGGNADHALIANGIVSPGEIR